MIPSFTVKLGQQIHNGLVVVGKFDGQSPSLACATTGGKILLHSPHEDSHESDSQLPSVRFLNFNRKITALAAGQLKAKPAGNPASDLLFVGTQSNLLAYDVDRNSDVFFRDVQDGVNALTVGKIGSLSSPLVIAGGNCSILGFDHEGNESFWTVTGDNVSSIIATDIDGDGLQELVVGSDDFEIRAFKQEELLSETTEADRVTHLAPVSGMRMAYGLSNGTVGVYKGVKSRLWRVKTKHKPTAILSYDINNDGVAEVISGWDNGMFNIRNGESGEVIFRAALNSPVAGVLRSDYRKNGKDDLLICTQFGEIKGYIPTDVELAVYVNTNVEAPKSVDQNVIDDLQAQKQELLNELKLLEKQAIIKPGESAPGSLPQNTAPTYGVEPDMLLGCVVLMVSVATDIQIVNVTVFDTDGAIFDGSESITISPRPGCKSARVPMRPTKHKGCSLRVQVQRRLSVVTHVSTRTLGAPLHVFEASVPVLKFSQFQYLADKAAGPKPTSQVSFYLNETISRINDWISSVFPVPSSSLINDRIKLYFVCTCGTRTASIVGDAGKNHGSKLSDAIRSGKGEPLHIIVSQADNAKSGLGGGPMLSVKLRCDSMELASEVLQDLARTLKIKDLESEVDFPSVIADFEEVLHRVEDYSSSRVRLAADMADDSQLLKALVIRAEDSRLMNDMESMRKAYTELFALNNQLIVGYNVRTSNHQGLISALKEVNLMIQRAANLRVGKHKNSVIAECRAAVKKNDLGSLIRIIKFGSVNAGNINK